MASGTFPPGKRTGLVRGKAGYDVESKGMSKITVYRIGCFSATNKSGWRSEIHTVFATHILFFNYRPPRLQ